MAYEDVYDRASAVFDNWQAWFDPDALDDVFPDDLVYPVDEATAMLDRGETLWHHPGWIADVHRLLDEWMHDGNLIRVRLTAEWLLSTMPGDPIDPELAPKLKLLAAGEFSQVWQGALCAFPALPETYLKSLKWGLVSLACDRVFAMGISRSGFTHMQKGDRHE